MSSTRCKTGTPYTVRNITDSDTSRICCQLTKAIDRAKDKEVAAEFELDYAMTAIMGNPYAVIVDEAYLVICVPSQCWYKPIAVLVEQLVLKIGDGDFSAVVQYLHDTARRTGCSRIAVGGALAFSNRAIARLYMRHGFIPEHSPILIRSI